MVLVNEAPAGRPLSVEQLVELRRFNLAQVIVNCLCFGIFIALAVTTLYRLWRRVRFLPQRTFLLIISHVIVVTIFYTIWIATTASISRQQLKYEVGDVRDVPTRCPAPVILAYIAITLVVFMNDGMLIHRCWIIMERSNLIIIPTVLFVIKTSLYVANGFIIVTQHRSMDRYLIIPGLGVSLANHIILSAAGCFKLLAYRRAAQSLGDKSGMEYVAVAYVLAFAGAIYAISNILALTTNNTTVQPLSNAILFGVAATSPLFIPLNVASVDAKRAAPTSFLDNSKIMATMSIASVTASVSADTDTTLQATEENMRKRSIETV
ncbi:hypothetical protein BKA62DRAFT_696003 [Auriculariales sp. MPI-PUGE-AT-0066]|nr:hypothetical protein BKA62DRAFT_696003 [Auriculariales sp. MPI-PUGE-AT-0066]